MEPFDPMNIVLIQVVLIVVVIAVAAQLFRSRGERSQALRRIGLVAPHPDDPLDVGQRRHSSDGGDGGAHLPTLDKQTFDCNRNS